MELGGEARVWGFEEGDWSAEAEVGGVVEMSACL